VLLSANIQKIAVIGNAAGGKTTLALSLGQKTGLPVFHVDSFQFLPGMIIRPHLETLAWLRQIQSQDRWIIDGYGPLDILQERLQQADLIVLIDLPLTRHFLWALKRQVRSLWRPRQELPVGCSDLSFAQTRKLFRTIWKQHHLMRPELLRILQKQDHASKTKKIRSISDFSDFLG
jgi:adenylate kinase family enzyme